MNIDNLVKQKITNRFSSVEFVVTEKCQNACKYCYRVKRHIESKIIYITPEHLEAEIEGIKKLFNVTDDFFNERTIELFGGEAVLLLDKFWNIARYLLDRFPKTRITVPTNARVLSDNSLYDVEKMIQDLGPRVGFSLSVDSPYQDVNRPLSTFGKMMGHNEKINYDRLFYLAKKYGFGFHPMFYSETVDQWYNTLKFFLDNGFVPYVLEVRHPMTKEQMVEGVKQLKKMRELLEERIKEQERRKNVNGLYVSINPRGLGCSALTTITIMPNGDVPFCHRLIDNGFVWANVLTQEVNWSLGIMYVSGYHHKNHPKCIDCPVRMLCSGPCAGMNYEYWNGAAWRPYDGHCDYVKLKAWYLGKFFEDWNKALKQYTDEGRLDKYIKTKFSDYMDKLT